MWKKNKTKQKKKKQVNAKFFVKYGIHAKE